MSTSITPSNKICYFEKPSKPLGPQPDALQTLDARKATTISAPQTVAVAAAGDGTDQISAIQPSVTVTVGPTINAEGQSLGTVLNVAA